MLFFFSSEQLAPQDTDGSRDLYEHYGGVTSLVSIGPVGGNNGQPVSLGTYWDRLASDDGNRVFFETTERLVSSDTDNSRDVYMARAGAGGYPRPKGATPLHVPLVPAFPSCTAPNRTHGPPLAFGSCGSPALSSANLTVGTPDANGAAANSTGYVQLNTRVGAPGPPDDADVDLAMSIQDVRCRPGVSPCGPANTAAGADYTGELEVQLGARITDKANGASPVDTGTVSDLAFPVVASCVATGSGAVGATCGITTSYEAVVPGSVTEGSRAIWQLGQIQVGDGGPDGDVGTSAGNTPFAVPGVFVPNPPSPRGGAARTPSARACA